MSVKKKPKINTGYPHLVSTVTPRTPITAMDSAAAIATITPTPMQIAKELASKNVNHNIILAGGALAANAGFTTSNIVALDSAIRNATSQSNIYTPAHTSSSNTLPSNILTTPSNLNANTITNQSYQLVLTVPKATHPRIKYSGTKKPEEITPLLVELPATATHLSSTSASLLDISAIAPQLANSLQSMPTSLAMTAPKSSQMLNLSSDLSPAIKYADIDDIELPDGSKIGYPTDIELKRMQQAHQHAVADQPQDLSEATLAEKYILAAAAIKGFDISLNDGGAISQTNGTVLNNTNLSAQLSATNNTSSAEDDGNLDPESFFACRHCGKKYRWKSTLRRHENDECGDKEPSHQCPYCPYKAKQRGNLGVHVRKHHAEMPQLESRRKRKN